MATPKPKPDDVFDVDRILQLVELMKTHDLKELDLKNSEQQIRLKRGGDEPAASFMTAPMMPAMAPPTPPPVSTPPGGSEQRAPAAEEELPEHIVVIKSPMVGTYYDKPNPDADSFVRVGDRVEPDTTVCIIEAMKVFNEISADVAGEVVQILVENEEPVEYGKPVLKVDTSK